ncbi:flagellar export chaperone FliS [Fusibacter sp. A1]|nr:flagellar export chaperone FliS [Fusibacter sp. A1]RXV62107.1 flagellar export chaperone FliS [Fusibacter sp. A1]
MLNPYNYSKPAAKAVLRSPNKPLVHQATKQKSQHDAYLEQKILTASPQELTLMLYEGLIKFIKMARLFNEQGNIGKTGEHLIKAQAIVSELQSTLDMDYEISNEFDALYDFIYDKLVESNVEKNEQHMLDALVIAEEMRDTWKEAMSLL